MNIAFIVGVARSGTSILGELIALHPDVRYLFEGNELWEAIDIPGRSDSHRLTADHASGKVIKTIRAVMKTNTANSALLVEKNPRNVLRIPFLHKILPEAKMIHIVRDGRDVACSLIPGIGKDTWEHLKPPSWRRFAEEKGIVRCAHTWKECMEIALHDLSKVPHLQIRYEDLVSKSREVAILILDYLGLSHHPAVLDFCSKIQNETEGSYHAKHQDEWFQNDHQRRVGRWSENLTVHEQKETEQIIGPLLEKLGYKTEHLARVTARPVCIAGMHRSGTSMVAQLLAKCGLYLGRQQDILGRASDNQDGFWENLQFVKLNDEILFRLGGAWDFPPRFRKGWEKLQDIRPIKDAAQKLTAAFQGHEPWGWKDPRNSLSAPFWEDILGPDNVRHIICLRNPLEVAGSIQKRNGNSFAFSFNLWLAYNKTILENTAPEQRIITHYEAFFSDPQRELQRLFDFLGIQVSSNVINEACSKVSRSLRHHAFKRDDLVKAGASRELIKLYEEMSAQAGPVYNQHTVAGKSDISKGDCMGSSLPSVAQEGSRSLQTQSDTIRKGLVSIVILTFNQLKFTQECIESIRQYTPEPHEIIFVENGSTDGTVTWLKDFVSKNTNCHLIDNGSNLGFARGCNQGINAASGEYILLLNNDVVVTAEWLSGLLECFVSEPGIGIVGPMTNNISGTQRDPNATYTTIKSMHEYAKVFREQHRHRRIPLRRIVGFCMLFSRELVDRIGMLDESFGTGNFEDDDFCLRAALEGYRNMIAGDVFIHHYGSRTFIGNKIDYGSTLSGHRKIFSEKWRIPANSDLGKKLLVSSALEEADELNQSGETDKAVERLLEGIQQAPDNPEIYRMMAQILVDAKRYQDGLDALKSIPDTVKRNAAEGLTGYAKEGLDLDNEAEDFADSVLAKEPTNGSALNLKGVLCYKRGDRPSAEAFFRRATEADPGFGEPYTNLGVMKWSAGDREGGLALLEQGFMLSPCIVEAATMYHAAITEMAAFARAERIFREAQALNPRNQKIAFLLIDLLLKQGHDDEAMSAIEDAMTVFTISDGLLAAALAVREKVGAKEIRKGPKKKNSLSLSMIVKNEEKFIAKCLMSVRPVADEMIVVDTGSTDRTQDIARALGAKVFELAWTGDFSEARNYAIAKSSGDWILSLDADEIISTRDHSALRELVEKSKPTAYKITTRNYSNEVGAQGFTSNVGDYPLEEAGLGWFPSTKARLFPNNPGIRFENPVHEFVESAVSKTNIPIKVCDIPVHHYGRLNVEKLRAKGEAYYQLGKKKLAEKGFTDPKALFELGVQAGELKKYDEAAELFEKLVAIAPQYPLAVFNQGLAYMELSRYPEALICSKKAYEMEPGRKECALNCAHCELILGDSGHAMNLLQEILRTVPDYAPALAIQAVAHALRGEKTAAIEIVEKLKSNRFDCSNCLHDMAEGLVLSGRYQAAMSVYDLIVQTHQFRSNTRELIEKCYEESKKGNEIPAEPRHAKGLNPYDRQLTQQEIEAKVHRSFVGGMWEEMGELQFRFLKARGMKPDHILFDVGCGSLRGGLHFITYLKPGNYYGIDLNASLIEGGRKELKAAGLADRKPHLLVNDKFEMYRFGASCDYAISVSVFTHIPMNHIIQCLVEMRKVLKPKGVYYATFFQAPSSSHLATLRHEPGGIVTTYHADPFHYSVEEFQFMAGLAGLNVTVIGDWGHPRGQRMLAFNIPT